MRVLLFGVLAAFTSPALAYDDCGGPPEQPVVPTTTSVSIADVQSLQQTDRDFALDVEGHLVCLQLAESDVGNDAGLSAARKAALVTKFQEQAADTRGRQSHWRDEFRLWLENWSRAHNAPVPPAPQD